MDIPSIDDPIEALRLKELERLGILDSEFEEEFDQIAQLAAEVTGCPMAYVVLVDHQRQWFKARFGTEMRETPREDSFCHYTIQSDQTLIVPDATKDDRFKDMTAVVENDIRYYAAHPLKMKSGLRIGTVCVADKVPRELTDRQTKLLVMLADQTVRLLEMRKVNNDLQFSRERIEESQRMLFQIFDSIPQMTFQADSEGNILAYNKRWYDYIGQTRDTRGWGWKEEPLHHPEDLERTIQTWSTAVKTGEPYEIEYRLRRHDGQFRWHLGRAVPLRDPAGKITQWFGTNTDIHDLRESQVQLRKAENRLDIALNAAQIGFWDWDAITGHTTISETLMRSWGIDPKTYKNTLDECLQRIHPDDRERVWEEIRNSTFLKKPYDVEYRVIRPTGEMIYVNARGEFYLDELGHPRRLTGVALDITERKQAEIQIRDARLAADAASAAKSAFLANMSHEIRSPLGAIMGFTELAQQTGLSVGEAQAHLQIVHRNSVQVLNIVDDILDLAKVEAGRMSLDVGEMELPSYLADFAHLMAFRARENGISLEMSAMSDIPECVLADSTRLRQILTNIVGNAVKFTKQGQVRIYVTYVQELLTFDVYDTGRGISEEQAKILFQPFVQADATTSRKFGGTGLGLALTRKLCEAMGGTFNLIESALDKGSHFRATILAPQCKTVNFRPAKDLLNIASIHVPAPKGEERALAGLKVLVVEDSPDNQALLQILLERQGAKFALSKDGAEGVQAALAADYDVIVMDVQMPGMDGHEAVRTLRKTGYRKPIVALTAHAMKEEYDRAFLSGFNDFLTKPVNRQKLIDVIRRLARV